MKWLAFLIAGLASFIILSNGVLAPPGTTTTLNTPANASIFNITSGSTYNISFNCSASGSPNISNATLFGNFAGSWQAFNNSVNIYAPGGYGVFLFSKDISNGTFLWNCEAFSESPATPSFADANRTFTIKSDTSPPLVTIYAPNNSTLYRIISINLSVSANETINTWWYKLNGGTNTTFTPNTTITAIQGNNNIIVYANDTFGNTGAAIMYFTIDTIAPIITIYSPANQTYNILNILLNVSVNEIIDVFLYSLNGGTNVTFGRSFTYIENGVALGNGGGTNLSLVDDGNWDTYGTPNFYYNIAWSIPNGIINLSAIFWQVKDMQGIRNLTIPIACSNWTNTIRTDFYVSGNRTYWKCYQYPAGASTLAIADYEGNRLYESAMWFPVVNLTISITALEGSNSIIVYANDTFGNTGSTIRYFTVEMFPNITFVSQNPSDIDSTNIFGNSLNMTYNISYVASATLNFKTNSTTSDCWVYVNGVATQCGFLSGGLTSNISNQWLFRLFDNQIYPATYNINETYMEQTPHSIYNLSTDDSYVKIRLYNISNTKQYSIYELMANISGSPLSSLRIYYCNTSYSNGDPDLSSYCTNFYSLSGTTAYNHTHSIYSRHMVIPFTMNVSTGRINNVAVTETSYFLLRGNSSDWNVFYINNDTSSAETTVNNGSTWSALNGTVDSHLHQFSDADTFWYFINSCNGVNCINSTLRYDIMEHGNLPPISPDVYNPQNASFSDGIDINYTESLSPNSYPIVSYNISLLNSDNSFNITIAANNYPNLGYIWDSTSSLDSQYRIKVEACDNNSLCSFGLSEIFTVDNTKPIVTIYSPQSILYNISATIPLQVSADKAITTWRYSLNLGINVTFTPNTTITGSQGLNSIIVYATDGVGNVGSATISFTLGIPPNIVIVSPMSTVYVSAAPLQVTADKPINTWWYVLNGGNVTIFVPNTTISGIVGLNSISVYANDSFGNLVSQNTTFTIRITQMSILGDFAVPALIVIGAGILFLLLEAFTSGLELKRIIAAIIGVVMIIAIVATLL